MRERPILMSGPLVRAIIEGRKSMTRRPVKVDLDGPDLELTASPRGAWVPTAKRGGLYRVPCPYGAPGDALWCRETWQQVPPTPLRDWPGIGDRNRGPSRWNPACCIIWRADGEMPGKERWRSGIHMPRWASRLTLDVIAVRVERLWDITEEDAINEGTENLAAFQAKWVEIYGAESWDANPWVWVISFRKAAPAVEGGRPGAVEGEER